MTHAHKHSHTDATRFGLLLRHQRVAAGLTQDDLAERAGLSVRGLTYLEKGARQPYVDTVRRLADALQLQGQERVAFQAAARPASAGLAAAQAADAPGPGELPYPPNPLIGRTAAVAAVGQLLRQGEVRLLTLVGPGGVGKTRLALEVAHALHEHFAQGVAFVELAPLADPALVAATIAHALGVRGAPDQPPAQALGAWLRDRHLLLVVDNCEHVLPGLAVVAALLAHCPSLQVLATSRAPLRLQAERTSVVAPLAVPDLAPPPAGADLAQHPAVALFVQRAQAVRPAFALTAANAPLLAAICQRLDGLPLAIELAAARIRVLPPAALLARLERRLEVLVGGGRDLPPRHQGLRATIAWSYTLLEQGPQRLFAQLGVFVGGCTLDAIAAVCAGEGEQAGVMEVEALVDNGLLQLEEGVAGEPRFVMLETIHEYARERLQATGEGQALRRRHAAYFLELAEAAQPDVSETGQAVWLRRLERDINNLRAALQWAEETGDGELGVRLAGALSWVWYRNGNLSEGREWLEKLLASTESSTTTGAITSLRAKALDAASQLAYRQGDHRQAVVLSEQSLDLHRKLGNKQGMAYALNELAYAARGRGEYTRATALFEESFALFRELGNRQGIAWTIINVGLIAYEQGDYRRAAALYQEGLALFRGLGDEGGNGLGWTLISLGNLTRDDGDADRAAALFEESLALFRELGDKQGIGTSLRGLGQVAADQGDHERAVALLEESLALFRTMGDNENAFEGMTALGLMLHERGEDGRAGALFAAALPLTRTGTGAMWFVLMALDGAAGVLGKQGQPARAARVFGAVDAARQAVGTPVRPSNRRMYERDVTAVREALGEDNFATAWAEGHALPLEQVVAEVVAEPICREATRGTRPSGGVVC